MRVFQSNLNEKESPVEWPMLLALLALMIIGAAFIYSATANNDYFRQMAWYRRPAFKQVAFYGLGLAGAIAICFVSYRRLARWSLVIYWATILVLIAVLIEGIGTKVFGARRWIN